MHSSSKKWVAPHLQTKEHTNRLNNARAKVCPNSPIWPVDFNSREHKAEWQAGMRRVIQRNFSKHVRAAEEKVRINRLCPLPTPKSIHAPFGGKTYATNHANVLGTYRTIFVPQGKSGKDYVAPWPGHAEMKYEGDDRISTDRLHRRFPALPRVETHSSIPWQQRPRIVQYAFDEFYFIPGAAAVMMRTHDVKELELDDKIGKELVGKHLMRLIDPEEQW